jgi:cell division transport system permease protein
MKRFLRATGRAGKSGMVKAFRLYYITIPLAIFFMLVITLAGFASFGYALSNHISNSFENRINMVVYFDKQASDDLVNAIVTKVQERTDVRKVNFHSKEDALETFKQKHETETSVLESLGEIGTNPFGASLVVFAKDSSLYESMAADIKALGEEIKTGSLSPVEEINYEEHKLAIEKFTGMLAKADKVAFILVIALSLMLLFTLYLALRFVTQNDREEVKIMKLVGAGNILTVGPTAVVGGVSGFFGALASLVILYFSADYLTRYTLTFDEFNVLQYFVTNFEIYFIVAVSFGLLFGVLGSILAVRRHL